MKYVTPEYEQQLNDLAEQLVTPERFGGHVAMSDTVELQLVYGEEPFVVPAEA